MLSFSIKFCFSIIIVSLLTLATYHFDFLKYLYSQGVGQLLIIKNAKPIHDVLKLDTLHIDIQEKLNLVDDVKVFAETVLGLKETNNYTTYYHHDKPLMWVVTASLPYELKAKQWSFPFFGDFPYKGYFDKKEAMSELEMLKQMGFDVGLRNPSAWSTLGWFKDPIYTQQLYFNYGVLIETIIHETVHSTIFIKDSIAFNENLASFIGVEGALLFLEKNKKNKKLNEYLNHIKRRKLVQSFILSKTKKLDSIYGSDVFINLDKIKKEAIKKKFLESYYDEYLCLTKKKQSHFRTLQRLNNTYFMSYLRYHNQEEEIRAKYENEFGDQIINLIKYYKGKYKTNS